MKKLHPRNKNRDKYDLPALTATYPELSKYIVPNKVGENTIDFSNALAVKALNKAILFHYYGIKYWDFPKENLCPPIPGRADYIHYIADLLAENNGGHIPTGNKITCLDIGIGASCIYPIIGAIEYGWQFIGSDIDVNSINSATKIIDSNPAVKGKVVCRLQKNKQEILYGILTKDEKIDISICNPPFHSTAEDSEKASLRKVSKLTGKKIKSPNLNFAGKRSELVYAGGERKFIHNMIRESKKHSKNCLWFTTLVSKESNLKIINNFLDNAKVKQVKTIEMNTGNKTTRIVAWTYHSDKEIDQWQNERWI